MRPFERQIRVIIADASNTEDAARQIQEMSRVRSDAILRRTSESSMTEDEPEAGEYANVQHHHQTVLPVCLHYNRKCSLRADCCQGRYFACRICHDEEMGHKFDRYALTHLGCRNCEARDVPVGKRCPQCDVDFAKYYCSSCHLYEDNDEEAARIYHCQSCGICRRGRGIGIDNHHCDTCDCCVPIAMKDTHHCTGNALGGQCPICLEDLADSTTPVLLTRCGHPQHEVCFRRYTETNYICPVCNRCLTDMNAFYQAIERQLEVELDLENTTKNLERNIFCKDCNKFSTARWHYQFHKCAGCSSFNTRVV